ncbi:MAG TPA: hypothetical protein VGD06_01190 [Acidobacteriota bacterium]
MTRLRSFRQGIPGRLPPELLVDHVEIGEDLFEFSRLLLTGAAPGETPYLFTLAIDPFPQIRRYRIELTPPVR